jgi:hypothetical protein
MEYPPFRRVPHGGFLSVPYALVKEPLSERRGAFLLVFRVIVESKFHLMSPQFLP